MEIYKKLSIMETSKGQHIFHVNDIGDNFYIILQGSCSVRLPRTKEMVLTEPELTEYIEAHLNDLLCEDNRSPVDFTEAKNKFAFRCLTKRGDKRKYRIKYLITFRDLLKGESFGELALLSTSNSRTATITCKTDCLLAYLSNTEYKKILYHVEAKKMQEVIEYFQNFSFLSRISARVLSQLIYSFEQQEYNFGNYVYKEEDKSVGVYLIIQGDFELLKKVLIVDEPYDPRFGPISKIPKKSETARLMVMSTGDSFGLHEVFHKPFKHKYSVK